MVHTYVYVHHCELATPCHVQMMLYMLQISLQLITLEEGTLPLTGAQ